MTIQDEIDFELELLILKTRKQLPRESPTRALAKRRINWTSRLRRTLWAQLSSSRGRFFVGRRRAREARRPRHPRGITIGADGIWGGRRRRSRIGFDFPNDASLSAIGWG
jgi:hypothetical protein